MPPGKGFPQHQYPHHGQPGGYPGYQQQPPPQQPPQQQGGYPPQQQPQQWAVSMATSVFKPENGISRCKLKTDNVSFSDFY